MCPLGCPQCHPTSNPGRLPVSLWGPEEVGAGAIGTWDGVGARTFLTETSNPLMRSGPRVWSSSEPEALRKAVQLRGLEVTGTDPEINALVAIEATGVLTVLGQAGTWSGVRSWTPELRGSDLGFASF